LIGTVFKAWVKNFINLFYPLSCLICKAALSPLSDKPLCEICWNKIEFSLPPFCRVCGKHLPAPYNPGQAGLPARNQNHAFICRGCQACVYFFKKARSVCVYEGIIKECIHLFKYKGYIGLIDIFRDIMIDFVKKHDIHKNVDLIVPVPIYPTKKRERTYNHAEILARSLSKNLQSPSMQKT